MKLFYLERVYENYFLPPDTLMNFKYIIAQKFSRTSLLKVITATFMVTKNNCRKGWSISKSWWRVDWIIGISISYGVCILNAARPKKYWVHWKGSGRETRYRKTFVKEQRSECILEVTKQEKSVWELTKGSTCTESLISVMIINGWTWITKNR